MRKVKVLPLDLAKIDSLPQAAAEAKNFFGEVGILNTWSLLQLKIVGSVDGRLKLGQN